MTGAARLLAVVAVVIAVADIAQVVWLGKGVGAIGGAVVYGAVAVGAWRRAPPAFAIAAVMPAIPLAVFAGVLGATTRDDLVDIGMIGVFVLQLVAAGAGAWALWMARGREPDQMR